MSRDMKALRKYELAERKVRLAGELDVMHHVERFE